MIGFPSKAIEDGVSLRFFSVVLSRREAVLLRGVCVGKVGWIHHVHIFLCTSFPLAFGVSYVFLVYAILLLLAELRHAVVLLPRAVVPQDLAVVPPAGAVVPQGPTIVPLLVSGSTVVSDLVPQVRGSKGRM